MRNLLFVISFAVMSLLSCTTGDTLEQHLSEQDIGAQIRNARITTGVTAAQLAEAIGLSEHNIKRIEQGGEVPNRDIIMEIEKTLGVEIVMDNI